MFCLIMYASPSQKKNLSNDIIYLICQKYKKLSNDNISLPSLLLFSSFGHMILEEENH